MIIAILFALAVGLLCMFSISSWSVTLAPDMQVVVPGIIVSLVAIVIFGLLYRRSLRLEDQRTAATKRSPRRIAFGITLMIAVGVASSGNVIGVYSAFEEGSKVDGRRSSLLESEKELAAWEQQFDEQVKEYGSERDVDAYVKMNLRETRESLATDKLRLREAETGFLRGCIAAVATTIFFCSCLVISIRSIRWTLPGETGSKTS